MEHMKRTLLIALLVGACSGCFNEDTTAPDRQKSTQSGGDRVRIRICPIYFHYNSGRVDTIPCPPK